MDRLNPTAQEGTKPQWFVMRDLKRSNARQPAYRLLEGMGIEVFTPMVWKLSVRQGRRMRERVPFMRDLLFVHDTRKAIDPVVERTGTLQYRYVRGGYQTPMTVRDTDMNRFIRAVRSAENPCYYTPDEISADMIGKKVRIIGGALDGYDARLTRQAPVHRTPRHPDRFRGGAARICAARLRNRSFYTPVPYAYIPAKMAKPPPPFHGRER